MKFCSVEEMAKAPPISTLVRGLYMGSERATNTNRRFDVVVCAAEELPYPSYMKNNFEYIHVPLKDINWNFHQDMNKLLNLVDITAQLANVIQHGGKVLIYCQMGINRSGLLSGLTLLHLGYPYKKALQKIRKRHRCTLMNKSFVNALAYADSYLI